MSLFSNDSSKMADGPPEGEADRTPGQARWCLGIDLGTTNCAMARVLLGGGQGEPSPSDPQVVPIPQVVAPGVIESRNLLPSYLYIPGPHELSPGALDLPWEQEEEQGKQKLQGGGGSLPLRGVGEFARNQGSRIPHRMVSSAKSWLCNPYIDRTAPVLPVNTTPEVERLSPLEASARYLIHLRKAWESGQGAKPAATHHGQALTAPTVPSARGACPSEHGCDTFMEEVVLTVPASFNEVARNLTVEAARMAGFSRPVLLEEPQAALYAWINEQGEEWRDHLGEGDLVLVCDVGGGTTDFSLIRVAGEGGELVFRRVAVGDHILLGGDNMDLALAWHVRTKLRETRSLELDSRQFAVLVQGCRAAKEALLNDGDLEVVTVTIPGRGSRLMGGTITAELTRSEVDTIILDGFLPPCEPWDVPEGADGAGFQDAGLSEMGLPYAADPAVTRHLASFLSRHARMAQLDGVGGGAPGGQVEEKGEGEGKREGADSADQDQETWLPTAILFNGGVFKSPKLQERIVGIIDEWLDLEGAGPLKVLSNTRYDSAVAAGAAYYGAVRRGRGIRIRGGTARSYYVGVTQSMPAVPGYTPPVWAVCLAPFGMEEGTSVALLERDFGLAVGAPTRFRFFSSSVRKEDPPGAVIREWGPGEMEELPRLETTLQWDRDGQGTGGQVPLLPGSRIPVNLKAEVTAVGTLVLSCVEKVPPVRGVGAEAHGAAQSSPPAPREWRLEFNLRQGRVTR